MENDQKPDRRLQHERKKETIRRLAARRRRISHRKQRKAAKANWERY